MGSIPLLNPREVVALLERLGFVVMRQRGSHRQNLELLAEAVPGLRRVALLSDPVNPAHPALVMRAKQAAQSLGLQLKTVEAREPSELETAFPAMARERVTALVVVAGGMLFGQYTRIADLALRNRLPSMSGSSEYVGA